MLATADGWIYEEKVDGWRIIGARVRGHGLGRVLDVNWPQYRPRTPKPSCRKRETGDGCSLVALAGVTC